jgi:ABC-type Fe3+ transport system substrate-binding protein
MNKLWERFVTVSIFLVVMGGTAWCEVASEPQTLQELIERAKASNRVVTMIEENTGPEIIRGREEAFKARFGFDVRLEHPPGHHRDVPVKVIQAAKSGRGVVDMWSGGTPLVLGMFRGGLTRQPPWQAIYEGWPLAKKLREAVPRIGGGPHGEVLSDHCMHVGFTGWSLAYNTKRVTKGELQGIKLDDLTSDKWRNRLIWDVQAQGIYVLPFAPGWDVERMRIFAHNIGANGTKLVSGGTAGLIQSLVQGEGDMGVGAMTSIIEQKTLGAPLDVGFADFVMGNLTVTCLLSPSVGDPNMAALYWAWMNFDGFYADAKNTGGGVFRLYEEEDSRFPLAHIAREHGITSNDQIIGPKTEEDAQKAAGYRKIAIQALRDGARTKKKIEP